MRLIARRALIAALSTGAIQNAARPVSADIASTPFDWTKAWTGVTADPTPKRTGLAVSELAKILEADLATKKYILTGDLTPAIFREDCRFQDPNNAVDGLNKYRQALSLLFRPEESTVTDVVVKVGDDGRSVLASYSANGVLKLPRKPVISGWSGSIVYSLDSDNLIASQIDVWNITRWDAIRQTFTPGE